MAQNADARTRRIRSLVLPPGSAPPLHQAEERVRLALATVEMGSFVWDLAEDRAVADLKLLTLLGLPADTTFHPLGTGALHVHRDDRQRYLEVMTRAGDPVDGAVIEEDIRIVGQDGGLQWVRVTAQTWWDGSPSRPRWCAGVAADVTHRIDRDEALTRAAREKDEFISMVAHELRNPLAPLRTALDLIRLSGESVTAIERVRTIMERQVAELGRLIDDLVDVSHVNAGTMRVRRIATPVDGIIHSAVEANRQRLDEKAIQLLFELPREPAMVDVDPPRLVQALSRLLSDATLFTEVAGTLRISVTVPPERTAREVVITIADSRHARIDGASRLQQPVAEGQFGSFPTQLGVSFTAARSLIELHDGSVQVHQGTHGRAAAFEVHLPLVAPPQPHADGVAPPERGSLGRHVVIIDDNEDAAHALAMLVWELGCEARVAYTGRAGIALLESFTPDVVLLDIGMADIDGYETCRRIRHLLADRVKIVAVSGFGLDRDKDQAQQAGFDGHLTKPADHSALARLLGMPRATAGGSVGVSASE